jgi:N-methylhydantoinase A
MAYVAGVDVGGTFTDVTLTDTASGRRWAAKTPSTPADQSLGFVAGLEKAARLAGVSLDAIERCFHGTTVATNTILQRSETRLGLITTAGFASVLEIGRHDIPRSENYFGWVKPPRPVTQDLIREVPERVDYHGTVVQPLDEAAARRAVRELRDLGVESIAVSLLYSFLNPAHEQRLRAIIAEEHPHALVSLSCEVLPRFREFERTMTTALNAYVAPHVSRYLAALERRLREHGCPASLLIMKSNGGVVSAETAARQAIHTAVSGPAAGVVGAVEAARAAGFADVISIDVGGTSADVCLTRGGRPEITAEGRVGGFPMELPMLDIHTIGAGGGSIAWIDKGGLLRVGPQSAGADPGPVCYDTGGEEVTVTDANLVMGRLNPDFFLGGTIALSPPKAEWKLDELGERISLDRMEAARAVVDIANENMANAIRVLSIDRGLDPREYALVAFGGAGPLHAADIAAKMGMKQVIIPVYPGLTSAFGALIAEPKISQVWSKHFRSDAIDARTVGIHFDEMIDASLDQLRREGYDGEPEIERSVSMRYWGQNYEQDVPMPPGPVTPELLERTLEAFHRVHEEFYGYSISGEVIELIRFNVTVSGSTGAVHLPSKASNGHRPGGRPVGERPVYFQGHGLVDTPIYRRDDLPAGFTATGPLIVEEVSSTTVVHPGQRLEVGSTGVMTIAMG